ncbi:DUF4352 domain-containing protein [Streptomyces sp. NPDC008121]|uniref:DUF4352 domain-containing protein n=1 Tax=Streptomyces sp. NPDC008121 TaxID=3364809 RepID=UPI0036EE8B62
MRTHTTTAALAAGLLLTVTGCGADHVRPTSGPAATAASDTPSPSGSPTAMGPLPFGAAMKVTDTEDGTAGTVTVLGYEQRGITAQTSADEEFGTSGYVWATIELKVCSTRGTLGATRYPWALAYADGSRIEPSGVTYGDFPKPEYPYEAKIKAGDCVRGKTVFAVPGAQRPERVLYTTDLFDTPPEWTVPLA